jgi:pimeloyl-ACP methyl ester carboxylesterase
MNGLTAPDVSFDEIEETLIRVRDVGSGPQAVVLVPDPPNVIEHYDSLIAHLGDRLRVICFELPGFGFSVPSARFSFSVDEYADLAACLLGNRNLVSPVWAASCLPAYVGLRLAGRYPGLLSGLVCGQAPSWEEELLWARRVDPRGVLSMPVLGQLLVAIAPQRLARGWYSAAALPHRRDLMTSVGLEMMKQGAHYSLASAFQGFFRDAERLGPVKAPTTFVWGLRDRTHRKTDRDSVSENADNPTIVEFEASAHFPELDEPERFARLIQDRATGSGA